MRSFPRERVQRAECRARTGASDFENKRLIGTSVAEVCRGANASDVERQSTLLNECNKWTSEHAPVPQDLKETVDPSECDMIREAVAHNDLCVEF